MSELQERLQASLGSAFAIQRELGGGGMSRVFLAEEVALGRSIVLKVLPPEMAAAVNVERFRREIRLAASLQHPHIVPIHSAGQSGDLLYYTMPFVEGESLRAKLAREGELPIGETVRIMRDVAEALAYAHDHGIVHRDIKPDNILISGSHAVVTDFGVAKAVSAASGASGSSSSVTSLGVALGTPAYMAPEQTAADPNVDARADIYALGIVGYEMLCGRPPFVGANPQQVLAAQVTLMPEPCTTYRASIPPPLAALIMRCLEKKPADRVQRADDLVTQLEAMTTPIGGLAATGAAASVSSSVSSGTEAAIRRSGPIRVTVLFALGASALAALAYTLTIRLGLPGWVVTGAVALLVVGLPMVLLTAQREHRRAIARATHHAAPQAPGDRLLTWRNALTGGGLALGAFAVVTTIYMAMRLLGIGPAGTLLAAGKLTDRQRIVLADFVNRTTDTTLGPTLTEAFRVDLAQSPNVRLEDPTAIAAALARMQRPGLTTLTPAVAREIAERQGLGAIVTGEIGPVGTGFVLSASILSAVDGSTLTAVRSSAADPAGLIPALDELSRALRERIGESLKSIRGNEPLEAVTTSSLDALRKYTEAVRLTDGGHYEEAIPLLEEATRIDTGFAMAYRKLSVSVLNARESRHRMITAATEAYVHRDRMPEHERDLAVGSYEHSVANDKTPAAVAFRAALAIDPTDRVALNDLATILNEEHQYAAAESLLIRDIKEGAGTPAYTNLARVQVAQGRYQAADSTLARLAVKAPTFSLQTYFESSLLSAQHQYPAAEKVVRADPKHPPPASLGGRADLLSLGLLSLVQGHVAQGEATMRLLMAANDTPATIPDYLRTALELAEMEFRFRNDATQARLTITQALAKHPLVSLPAEDRPYAELVRGYAEIKQVDEARRTWAQYEHDVPNDIRTNSGDWYQSVGDLAAVEGRDAVAIAAYRHSRESTGCITCQYFEMAQAFQHAGQPDSAIVYYTLDVETPELERLETDAMTLASSYQRLGELYEHRGDRAKAVDYYGRLIELWRTADPELQPILRDVRSRVARLTGESGLRDR